MSRFRDIKRQARGALHQEIAVPAIYLPAPSATPIPCTVRVWLRSENHMVGDIPGVDGSATRAEPEDRIRFDLSEFSAPLRQQTGIVSVEAGEAYRLDHLYPADLGYQTARVTRLSAAETVGLPVPA